MITGAAGLVGGVLREQLRSHYRLVLLDRGMVPDPQPLEEVVRCDIRDSGALDMAMEGVDAVVHLAGEPTEAAWEAIRDANIEGLYRVVEAARGAGVRRFLFASTNHVVGYYPRTEAVGADSPPRPDTRYGVSKVFGEALLRLYADKFSLTAVCIRIGTLRRPDAPGSVRHLSTWVSHRDLGELVRCSIEADVQYEIVYGVSNNARRWWHDRAAERLGYRAVDDAELFASILEAGPPSPADVVADGHQGGEYCSWERPR
jgi:uronate dehydrogenase